MFHAFSLSASFVPGALQAIKDTGFYIRDRVKTLP